MRSSENGVIEVLLAPSQSCLRRSRMSGPFYMALARIGSDRNSSTVSQPSPAQLRSCPRIGLVAYHFLALVPHEERELMRVWQNQTWLCAIMHHHRSSTHRFFCLSAESCPERPHRPAKRPEVNKLPKLPKLPGVFLVLLGKNLPFATQMCKCLDWRPLGLPSLASTSLRRLDTKAAKRSHMQATMGVYARWHLGGTV